MTDAARSTEDITYQCPFCSREPYREILYALGHLKAKHSDEYQGMLVGEGHAPDLGDPPAVDQSETTGVVAVSNHALPLTITKPGNLLHDPTLVITYDATNLHELEAALGEFCRLTADGPQILTWYGEDFSEGWEPLHDHSTVVLFNEGAHPVQLTPAAAIGLGLREGHLPER